MSNQNHGDYKKIASEARLKVLEMVYKAKSSHIGSNFSIIDILTVLFDKHDKNNDKIILSCGWKAAAFYYFLAKRGDFPTEWLDTYNQEGSKLIGLTEPGVPGVLFAGGSMQMGLPAAVGFALSKKIKGEAGRVYCIVSDGELAGGMIYESVLNARHHHLDNLFIIVDNNHYQAMGDREKILGFDIPDLLIGLKCELEHIDGHNFEEIEESITGHWFKSGPKVILCETTKGKGVSFMENNNLWHYKDISDELYEKAKQELS